jgi:hypothetical protein
MGHANKLAQPHTRKRGGENFPCLLLMPMPGPRLSGGKYKHQITRPRSVDEKTVHTMRRKSIRYLQQVRNPIA